MAFVQEHLRTKKSVNFGDSQERPNHIELEILADTVYVKVYNGPSDFHFRIVECLNYNNGCYLTVCQLAIQVLRILYWLTYQPLILLRLHKQSSGEATSHAFKLLLLVLSKTCYNFQSGSEIS